MLDPGRRQTVRAAHDCPDLGVVVEIVVQHAIPELADLLADRLEHVIERYGDQWVEDVGGDLECTVVETLRELADETRAGYATGAALDRVVGRLGTLPLSTLIARAERLASDRGENSDLAVVAHTASVLHAWDVELSDVASSCQGWSGTEIAAIIAAKFPELAAAQADAVRDDVKVRMREFVPVETADAWTVAVALVRERVVGPDALYVTYLELRDLDEQVRRTIGCLVDAWEAGFDDLVATALLLTADELPDRQVGRDGLTD